MDVRELFRFPDPVNEWSARLVATGVVAQVALFLVLREGWLLVPLAYGFVARVLTGPTLSPLGQAVTRVVTPAIEARLGRSGPKVPGPPKRFAQGVGVAFSFTAAVAWLAGAPVVSVVVLAGLFGAASLEAFAGVCLGCVAYRALWGCEDCDDVSERLAARLAERDAEPGETALATS